MGLPMAPVTQERARVGWPKRFRWTHTQGNRSSFYAGQSILVRFQMITDDAINQPGIAIDDVRIPEIGYVSDFELDDGGWEAEGWIRMDNVLPQQAWVTLSAGLGHTGPAQRGFYPNRPVAGAGQRSMDGQHRSRGGISHVGHFTFCPGYDRTYALHTHGRDELTYG